MTLFQVLDDRCMQDSMRLDAHLVLFGVVAVILVRAAIYLVTRKEK